MRSGQGFAHIMYFALYVLVAWLLSNWFAPPVTDPVWYMMMQRVACIFAALLLIPTGYMILHDPGTIT